MAIPWHTATMRRGCNPQVLGVPYVRPEEAASHAFIDLKVEPHRIDELPEPRRVPELRELLGLLNAPGSPFFSIGCEQGDDDRDRASGGAQCWSYVGFGIDGWPFEFVDFTDELGATLYELLAARSTADSFSGSVQHRRTQRYDRQCAGMSLEIWLCGYGHSADEARARWRRGMARTYAALQDERQRWASFLREYPDVETYAKASAAATSSAPGR